MRLLRILGADEAARAAFVTDLIAALSSRGRAVSVLGRVAPDLEFDRPGKDSYKHRAAGARDVAVISPACYRVIHEAAPTESEPKLAALLARLSPVDVVLALGFDEPQGEAIRLEDNLIELSSGRRFARDDLDGLAACLTEAS